MSWSSKWYISRCFTFAPHKTPSQVWGATVSAKHDQVQLGVPPKSMVCHGNSIYTSSISSINQWYIIHGWFWGSQIFFKGHFQLCPGSFNGCQVTILQFLVLVVGKFPSFKFQKAEKQDQRKQWLPLVDQFPALFPSFIIVQHQREQWNQGNLPCLQLTVRSWEQPILRWK